MNFFRLAIENGNTNIRVPRIKVVSQAKARK